MGTPTGGAEQVVATSACAHIRKHSAVREEGSHLCPLCERRRRDRHARDARRVERVAILLDHAQHAAAQRGRDRRRVERQDALLHAAARQEALHAVPGRVRLAKHAQHGLEDAAHGGGGRLERAHLRQVLRLEVAHGALRLVDEGLHLAELRLHARLRGPALVRGVFFFGPQAQPVWGRTRERHVAEGTQRHARSRGAGSGAERALRSRTAACSAACRAESTSTSALRLEAASIATSVSSSAAFTSPCAAARRARCAAARSVSAATAASAVASLSRPPCNGAAADTNAFDIHQ